MFGKSGHDRIVGIAACDNGSYRRIKLLQHPERFLPAHAGTNCQIQDDQVKRKLSGHCFPVELNRLQTVASHLDLIAQVVEHLFRQFPNHVIIIHVEEPALAGRGPAPGVRAGGAGRFRRRREIRLDHCPFPGG